MFFSFYSLANLSCSSGKATSLNSSPVSFAFCIICWHSSSVKKFGISKNEIQKSHVLFPSLWFIFICVIVLPRWLSVIQFTSIFITLELKKITCVMNAPWKKIRNVSNCKIFFYQSDFMTATCVFMITNVDSITTIHFIDGYSLSSFNVTCLFSTSKNWNV